MKTILNQTRTALILAACSALASSPVAARDAGPAGIIDRGPAAAGNLPTAALGTVVGTVTTAAGLAVPGATVRLVGTDRGVLTDGFGRFSLTRVPAGEVRLAVSRLGFAERKARTTLTGNDVVRLDVVLDEQVLDLAPVQVLAERTRLVGDPARLGAVTGAAHLLERRELDRIPNAFGDVQASLRTLPGVYVQDEEGFGMRPNIGLRGSGVDRSSRVTVMEDGVLIAPAPYAAPAAYYFPVAARMEAIEVRMGSSQVKYGPRTVGGAVNLVSSSIPDRTSWTAELTGGSESTFRARMRAGGSVGRFGWLVETVQVGTDGFKQLQGGGDTGFRLQDYVGKLRWTSAPEARVHQQVELKAGYTDELSDETYLGLTDADFARSPLLRYAASAEDLMDAEHDQLQLRHFASFRSGLDLTTTVYRNGFARNWYKLQSVLGRGLSGVLEDPGSNADALAVMQGANSSDDALRLRANNRTYVSEGVQSVLGIRGSALGTAHDLEVGVRLHRDHEDRFQWEDGYRMADGRMTLTSRGTPGTQANQRVGAEAVSAWIHDEITLGRLTLTPGVRLESVDFTRTDWSREDPDRSAPVGERGNGVTQWIPGVGAAWQLTPALSLFGGVHRGFAPPGAGASSEADPERSVNYEAGARFRGRGLALSGTAFYSDYSNLLGAATLAAGGDGSGEQFNGGAVDLGGLELALDVDPLWGRSMTLRLPMRVAYAWTHAEFATSFESDFEAWGSVQQGDRLPYLPEHQLAASAGLEGGHWRIEASVFGNTEMRTMAGQGAPDASERTDAFAVVGVSAEYGLPQGGTLVLAVQNLLDERYVVARRPAGTRPGLPRTISLGVRVGG